ncbi:FtsX-like permease family protein [Nonomuraea sp. SYSU D8015]|uniref:FtsX-like permease family protein n=1 Tax=Nonomuraea sp. SYSU D8015 TaxID=2593644 RepID=UPI00166117E9|nr:FtsX-like permease family protein [Nonomuraea sp. SYSU D8015]
MILRGLWERRTLSLVVLLIAIVPIASAAVGPVYSAAARTTIARDAVKAAPLEGRGWRYTTAEGGIEAKVAAFTSGAGFVSRPIFGMETNSGLPGDRRSYALVWQDGQCEHLTLVKGRCPSAGKEVMASEASGFKVGRRFTMTSLVNVEYTETGRKPAELTVVGIYRPGAVDDPFWFGRSLFSTEGEPSRDKVDALFTVPQTRLNTYNISGDVSGSPSESGWTDYAIFSIDPDRLEGTDVEALVAMQAAAESVGRNTKAIVFSRVGDMLKVMTANTGSLGVPTLLVIAQLVALGWILLFQTVGDLVRARGAEIALARLRGHGRVRVWLFALAEPLLLLAAAVPLGLLVGHAAAGAMIGALLPADVPARFPPDAALAGVAAMLGGVLAAALAGWRTATRPVTEEWRRTPRRTARGWALDAVVLAVTALGLVELLATGVITDVSGRSSGAMAVPGLIALGVALVGSRVLPVLTRRLFGVTRRHGGLGPFLALRQVARGPVTAGSVIVLGTAFGLATFAVSAWTATSGDYAVAARFHNGAATAITVRPVEPSTLIDAVKAADPGGRTAAPVIKVPGPPQLIAADPARLAAVGAAWRPDLAGGRSLPQVAAALPGRTGPRVWVRGDRFRAEVTHDRPPKDWQIRLSAVFRVPGHLRPTQLPLGTLTGRSGVHEWNLPPACERARCELRAFRGDALPPAQFEESAFVRVTVKSMAVREQGRWRPLDLPPWRVDDNPPPRDGTFAITMVGNQTLRPDTYDEQLAAVAVGPIGTRVVPGLDNAYAGPVRTAVTSAAAPGLTDAGVLVDLEQADRAAYGVHEKAEFQVWTSLSDTAALERALERQGLSVTSRRHVDDLTASFAGQGPGLALLLLLVSALAAAALALGRTVLALYTAARRRAYELAALEASGAEVAALRVALLLEQVITVAAGTLAGLLAGLAAAWAALGRIPQFAEAPVTPPLPHEVAAAPVALVVGAALLVSLLAAGVVSELLLRGIRVERLRDAPA